MFYTYKIWITITLKKNVIVSVTIYLTSQWFPWACSICNRQNWPSYKKKGQSENLLFDKIHHTLYQSLCAEGRRRNLSLLQCWKYMFFTAFWWKLAASKHSHKIIVIQRIIVINSYIIIRLINKQLLFLGTWKQRKQLTNTKESYTINISSHLK